jgi:hypothetical protein
MAIKKDFINDVKFFIKLKDLIYTYIMSKDKDKEAPETSNSKESATLPSKASSEEDDELTTTKPAEEREVVVVKPSKTVDKRI